MKTPKLFIRNSLLIVLALILLSCNCCKNKAPYQKVCDVMTAIKTSYVGLYGVIYPYVPNDKMGQFCEINRKVNQISDASVKILKTWCENKGTLNSKDIMVNVHSLHESIMAMENLAKMNDTVKLYTNITLTVLESISPLITDITIKNDTVIDCQPLDSLLIINVKCPKTRSFAGTSISENNKRLKASLDELIPMLSGEDARKLKTLRNELK